MKITNENYPVSAIKQLAIRLRKQHALLNLPKETHAYYLDKISNIYGYESWTILLKELDENPFPYDVKSIINHDPEEGETLTEHDNFMFPMISRLIENAALTFNVNVFNALPIIELINNSSYKSNLYLQDVAFSFDNLCIKKDSLLSNPVSFFKYNENSNTNITTISNPPGSGKSALANAILNEMSNKVNVSFITRGKPEYRLVGPIHVIAVQKEYFKKTNFAFFIQQCINNKSKLIVIDESDFFASSYDDFKASVELATLSKIPLLIVTQSSKNLFYKHRLNNFSNTRNLNSSNYIDYQ